MSAISNISPDLPLIDLHRHLDGSVRLETILELGLQHNLPLPAFELEQLRPFVQVDTPQPGILAFFEKFALLRLVMVDYDACYRIAYENVADAHREGIDYIELRFSPWFMAERHELDAAGVVEAVVAGVQAGARDYSVLTNLIGIISRHYGPAVGQQELAALLGNRDDIVALDLAGDEANFPASWFREHFQKARDAGWQVTAHAGEEGGPESIWQAIDELGATRIGHGVRAFEDTALVEKMLQENIGVEVNLTSNVQTMTVSDFASHPLREMLAQGFLATINTDDPGISAIDLPHEYEVAAPQAGLTRDAIRTAQGNALQIAFLTAAVKAKLKANKIQ